MAGPVLVFDLDDTLYPERAYALSGFRAASRWAETAHGLPPLEARMAALLDEGHLGRLFAIALSEALPGHTPEQLAGLVAAYRDHEPDIALHDDAPDVLEHYGRSGPLGLITDGTTSMQQAKVRALGLERRFDRIVYTDALGPGRAYFKPHARAFEVIAAALPSAGRPLVYVGDNPAKDFVAPNAMGWVTVQVLRPGRIHAKAEAAPGGAPHHVVQSLAELPELLGG